MSNFTSIIEYIKNLCSEDTEIDNISKEIEEFNQENNKIDIEMEDLDRDHIRLQIELYNIESIISQNDPDDIDHFQWNSMKMYKDCIELKSLIDNIDFTKILKCHHMEMEAKCRKEWHPIQDCFVKTLKWQDQMEQRFIVQKYRQAEVIEREVEENNKKQLDSMEKSLQQTIQLIEEATEQRIELIVDLIRGSKDMESIEEKMVKLEQYQIYIEKLRQEKLMLTKQLEETQLQIFNPIPNTYCSRNFCTRSARNVETTNNFIMPNLPSFTDILKSFNQTEKRTTTITAMENGTNICIKSILRNSNYNQSITTKQTKNVRFKLELEEYQEDLTENLISNESENENDFEIEVSEQLKTNVDINNCKEENEILQEMKNLENVGDIETIDLLTPAENLVDDVEDNNQDLLESSNIENSMKTESDKKPLIEIQECIIFKKPFSVHDVSAVQDKEHVLNNSASGSKQSINSSSSPSSNTGIKEILNTTKKSFYEEFLNVSLSTETSPKAPMQSNSISKPSILKDFESFFNANKDYLFGSKKSNEEEQVMEKPAYKTSTEIQDFLDFGSSKGFAFDSDDNMNDNYNAGDMDFM